MHDVENPRYLLFLLKPASSTQGINGPVNCSSRHTGLRSLGERSGHTNFRETRHAYLIPIHVQTSTRR